MLKRIFKSKNSVQDSFISFKLEEILNLLKSEIELYEDNLGWKLVLSFYTYLPNNEDLPVFRKNGKRQLTPNQFGYIEDSWWLEIRDKITAIRVTVPEENVEYVFTRLDGIITSPKYDVNSLKPQNWVRHQRSEDEKLVFYHDEVSGNTMENLDYNVICFTINPGTQYHNTFVITNFVYTNNSRYDSFNEPKHALLWVKF